MRFGKIKPHIELLITGIRDKIGCGYILAGSLVVILVFSWVVTYGTWAFFEAESFGVFYDAQASSLLNGRLDVPPTAIGPEAYIINQKYHGYFGIGPALMRIPSAILLPGLSGRWSRIFMLIACLMHLAYIYLVLKTLILHCTKKEAISKAHSFVISIFIILIGIGSTNIFLASRSFIYHEALMWGSAFSIAGCYYFLRYLLNPIGKNIWPICVCSLFAFNARVTVGSITIALCLAVSIYLILIYLNPTNRILKFVYRKSASLFSLPGHRRPGRHAIVFLSAAIIIMFSALFVNYLRFGSFLNNPLEKHIQFIQNPERIKRTDGKILSPRNVPTTFYNYFSPDKISFRKSFPWVQMTTDATVFSAARLDAVETFSSLPASTPALFLLTMFGLYFGFSMSHSIIKNMRLIIIASFIGGTVTLNVAGVTQRYLHDFYPFLMFSGAVGIVGILLLEQVRLKRIILALGLPLFLFSVYANTAFALLYQREIVWGVPIDKRIEFRQLRNKIDGLFNIGPLPAGLTDFTVDWLDYKISSKMQTSKVYDLTVTLRNASDQTWPSTGVGKKTTYAVGLSYHWLAATGDGVVVFEGFRTALPHDIAPGETITLNNVRIVAPPDPGSYRLQITLVQDKVAWFEQQGANTIVLPVTVQ